MRAALRRRPPALDAPNADDYLLPTIHDHPHSQLGSGIVGYTTVTVSCSARTTNITPVYNLNITASGVSQTAYNRLTLGHLRRAGGGPATTGYQLATHHRDHHFTAAPTRQPPSHP